jgi:hypothetical protein
VTALPHSIGRAVLSVDLASEEIARSLVPRMDDIHARRIAPILERVLDEVNVEGAHVTLDQIVIDLGTLPFTGLEDALAERLPGALREALEDAMRGTSGGAHEPTRRPEGEAWLDVLERALLHATAPFWAPRQETLSLEALMMDLAEREPDGLVRVLRRHRGRRDVLERIAWQLGGEAMAKLLRALDPENAALILAYLLDLHVLHREEALVDLAEEVLGRTLWVLVLEYELRDPGTQFNRKSFVTSLIEGLAESEGVEANALFLALAVGLRRTAQHRPLSSSLPAVLETILADRGVAEAETARGGESLRGPLEALEAWLSRRAPPSWAPREAASFEALMLLALRIDPARVAASILRWGRDDRIVDYIVQSLSTPARERLLHTLTPESAAVIVAYLGDLGEAHRHEVWTKLGDDAFEDRLWVLTLTYVARDPGTQWNRKSFVRSLLGSMAASESVAYEDLLVTVQTALATSARHRPLDASLLLVLRELSDDLAGEQRRHVSRWGVGGASAWASDEGLARADALSYLAGEEPRGERGAPRDALVEALWSMLDEPSPDLSAFLASHLSEPRFRERWAEILPRDLYVRLLAAALSSQSLTDASEALILALRGPPPPQGVAPTAALLDLLERELLSGGSRGRAESLAKVREARSRLGARGGEAGAKDPRLSGDLRAHVLAFLEGREGGSADARSMEETLSALTSMLEEPSSELRAFLLRHARDARVRARWAKLLPEPVLARMVAALAPRNHEALTRAARLLSTAWESAAPGGESLSEASSFFSRMLDVLSAHPTGEPSVAALAFALTERFVISSPTSAAEAAKVGERFLESALRLAEDSGQTALLRALQRSPAALPPPAPAPAPAPASPSRSGSREQEKRSPAAPKPPPPHHPPVRGRTTHRLGGSESGGDLGGQAIFIDNAGLVLTAPFLPRLFEMLDMLGVDDDGKPRMRDRETASRAVHLLQYLVDGRTDAPEATLPLAKILCGLPTDAPIAKEIEITDAERKASERFLRSVIANWGVIPNTSIAGLRETFLQREGKLYREPDRFVLRVERKTLDILVDQIPWSIAIVYHAFMPCPLHVTW